MDCTLNQCKAPLNNTRCTNYAIAGSSHCQLHKSKATSLYIKYKKFSDIVDKIDIHKPFKDVENQISHIVACYVVLNKTHDARVKHRSYALVPECFDSGHDFQFTKLKQQIEICETILSKLYAQQSESSSESSVDYDEGTIYVPKQKTLYQRVKKCRQDTEKDINLWIDKYIIDNKAIMDNRISLVGLIEKFIGNMFKPYNADISPFIQCVMVTGLVSELCRIDYLEEGFKPRMCEYCGCGSYVPYTLTVTCECVQAIEQTVFAYYNLSAMDGIKEYYETLLFKRSMILPMVKEIVYLHKLHGDKLIDRKLYLTWTPNLGRLKIEQERLDTEDDIPYRKHHQFMALNRLKDKFYRKKLLELGTP